MDTIAFIQQRSDLIAAICAMASTLHKDAQYRAIGDRLYTIAKKTINSFRNGGEINICTHDNGCILLAFSFVEAQELEQAIEVIGCIHEQEERSKDLADIGLAIARAGAREQAINLISSIKDKEVSSQALNDFTLLDEQVQGKALRKELLPERVQEAFKFIKSGQLTDAKKCYSAQAMSDPYYSGSRLLSDLCVENAKFGRIEKSIEILSWPCQSIGGYVQGLAKLAPHFEQIEPGLALVVFKEAVRIAPWVNSSSREVWTECLNALSSSS
ncbi:hypothetical protein [Gloeobacter morelensis]|uniref:Adenylate cyclase n=1 Tax=Gloeobacter morelensis MG652769 TaxID=2781736 RepID=A0ABY3PS16_9CYAN|nr:hypothetical protein [Gloeobacter morelensis]UFP96441.1 hypothetical protein ISF26_09610 [Gloeobacter morelensis MG652769]